MTIFKKLKAKLQNLTQRELEHDNADSQPHVLASRMRQANISHNEMVLADIVGVRVTEEGKLRFCPVQSIEVTQRLSPGDEARIPNKVTLHGLKMSTFTRPDWYILKNVLIHANGTITITPTKETKWKVIG